MKVKRVITGGGSGYGYALNALYNSQRINKKILLKKKKGGKKKMWVELFKTTSALS